jgi:hypothetical protein
MKDGFAAWHPPRVGTSFLHCCATLGAPSKRTLRKRKEKLPGFLRTARTLMAGDFPECEIRKDDFL